jgi:hypothetical protein
MLIEREVTFDATTKQLASAVEVLVPHGPHEILFKLTTINAEGGEEARFFSPYIVIDPGSSSEGIGLATPSDDFLYLNVPDDNENSGTANVVTSFRFVVIFGEQVYQLGPVQGLGPPDPAIINEPPQGSG